MFLKSKKICRQRIDSPPMAWAKERQITPRSAGRASASGRVDFSSAWRKILRIRLAKNNPSDVAQPAFSRIIGKRGKQSSASLSCLGFDVAARTDCNAQA
ncbi:MAG: hypothetical protein ACE5GQ_07155, partial [Nitrospinales bacterium]